MFFEFGVSVSGAVSFVFLVRFLEPDAAVAFFFLSKGTTELSSAAFVLIFFAGDKSSDSL